MVEIIDFRLSADRWSMHRVRESLADAGGAFRLNGWFESRFVVGDSQGHEEGERHGHGVLKVVSNERARGGIGKKMANAWEAGSREDYLRMVELASPAFLENMLKAARMATQGATTPTGKVLFDAKGKPIRETTGEAIARIDSN